MADPWENDPVAGPWENDPVADPQRSFSSSANEFLGNAVNAAEGVRKDAGALLNETALPAVNQAIANLVGLPVDAVNMVLRAVGMGSDKPVGGSETVKGVMGAAGINTTPDTSTEARKLTADVAPGVALGLPFGAAGAVAGALSGGGAYVGREVGQAVGGDTGGKIGAIAGSFAGGGIPSAAKAVGRAAAPTNPAEVAMLQKGGVKLTTGQTVGGEFQRAEQAATSIPGLGGAVKGQLEEAGDSFVRATINKALEPLGEKLSPGVKAGHEAVADLQKATSNAYDELLPRLKVIRDKQFDDDVAAAIAENFPGNGRIAREARQTFLEHVNTRMFDKFDDLGTMAGRDWKQAESVVGGLAEKYRRLDRPEDQAVGEALKDVQTAWRNMLARNNPEEAQTISNINRAYAMQLRIEAAAVAAKHQGGRFTPGQLATAATARSAARTRQAAAGDALLQQWATAGEKVMGGRVPDSGTPFRTAMRDIAYRPAAGAAAVAGSVGLGVGLNAALRKATGLSRTRTAPAVPAAFGASMLGGQ